MRVRTKSPTPLRTQVQQVVRTRIRTKPVGPCVDASEPLPEQPRMRRKPQQLEQQLDTPPAQEVQNEPSDQEIIFTIRQKAAEAKAKVLEFCRTDVNAFCEYVLVEDLTGKKFEQSEFHLQLQADLTKHRQIVVMSHPESGKTQQIVGRVLWELGRNPNLRIMLLYNSEDSATATLSTIRRYIESSHELHDVFPALKKGDIWKDDAIVVQRTAFSRDPSIRAVGYNSRRIGGARIDMLVIDDLLDGQVTGTEVQRRKLSTWVKNPVLVRLSEGALVAFLTNAWHPRDLAHELVKDRGWHLIRRPIRNPDGKIWWDRWSEARLKARSISLGALEYARSFECDPRDDGSRVFRPEHVEMALAKGQGYSFVHGMEYTPEHCFIVSGMDVAAGDDTKKQGAKTVITTVFFHPNGIRQVIRIRAGRWRARQILNELDATATLFPQNHWIVVESNNVQRWLIDLANEHKIEIGVALVPFHTGRNKRDPVMGVASMAAEFEARKWILPKSCIVAEEQEEVDALVAQAIDYVPESHTGDHLMSAWFAREIGRVLLKKMRSDESGDSGGSRVISI